MGANPKLPHGLTVQELKEMTKARLQAEASVDFRDPAAGVAPSAPPPIRAPKSVIPVPVQSNSGHSIPSSGSGGPPSSVGSGSGLLRTIPVVPPNTVPPPGYHGPSHFEMPPHPPIDTLDNASVSTAASDYPDSVYSLNGSREEAIPFARSASYPNHYSSGENSLPETASYHYNNNSNPQMLMTPTNEPPNRRRAATLSPRPAAYADWRRQMPTRTRSAVHPDNNRARTNSAVSLPAFSTTDEEFRIRSRIRSVREDAPWVSDVFRGSSGGSLQSRPSSEVLAPTTSVGCLHDSQRMWGEPFFACGQDISDDLASILKLSGAEEK